MVARFDSGDLRHSFLEEDMVDESKLNPDFENFLFEYYAEQNPEVLDDMLPDCTNDWVADLDSEDWIRLGNIYAKKYSDLIKAKETK